MQRYMFVYEGFFVQVKDTGTELMSENPTAYADAFWIKQRCIVLTMAYIILIIICIKI